VKKMKHYDPAKWPLSAAATANPTAATALTSPQANLMVHIPKMREDHLQFSSELAR
jgi:cytoplasmic FMR1 interacting protein